MSLFLFLIFALTACGPNNESALLPDTTQQVQFADVTVTISPSGQLLESGLSKMQSPKEGPTPPGVNSVDLTISGADMTTIVICQATTPVTNVIITTQVPIGNNRSFVTRAFNTSNCTATPSFVGQAVVVNIIGGQTNIVAIAISPFDDVYNTPQI